MCGTRCFIDNPPRVPRSQRATRWSPSLGTRVMDAPRGIPHGTARHDTIRDRTERDGTGRDETGRDGTRWDETRRDGTHTHARGIPGAQCGVKCLTLTGRNHRAADADLHELTSPCQIPRWHKETFQYARVSLGVNLPYNILTFILNQAISGKVPHKNDALHLHMPFT